MMNLTSLTAALLRGGRRMTGGLLAAALLLPLPAMALTFTGAWTPVYSQSGGPTPPKPIYTDTVVGQLDDLTVDMGTYQGKTATAKSSITLTRGISITQAGGQDVMAEADYATYLAHAGFNVSELVTDSKGHTVMGLSGGIFTVNNGNATNLLYTGSGSTNVNIADGNYTLTVSLTYTTNNKLGSWKMKSKHHFELMGM